MFHGHLDYFQKPHVGGRPNTKPGDHGTLNTRKHWFILFYHVWGPAWIDVHWNSIWLRASRSHTRSHTTSHYTRGSMTTLHDFRGVFGRPLGTSFGLSQFHGHISWLVHEVALSVTQHYLSCSLATNCRPHVHCHQHKMKPNIVCHSLL